MDKTPSAAEYLLATLNDWAELMGTGKAQIAFAVVLNGLILITAAIAVLSDEQAYRIASGIGSLLLLLSATYRVWAKERIKTIGLQERLEPQLTLSFDRGDDGCFHLAPAFLAGQRIGDLMMVRALPNCGAPVVHGVTGYLNGIYRLVENEWKTTKYNEALPLTWAILDHASPIDIIQGKRQFLNVLFISKNKIAIYGDSRPARAEDVFNFSDIFRVDVLISSDVGDVARLSLRLKVGENWQAPEILEVMK